jgi:HTH-type transcriptional regulator/antitoxin HigA
MNIKPIKTEQDLDSAVSQIEALWDAKDGTPKSDKLDVLCALVAA